jgi:hypothetical protein
MRENLRRATLMQDALEQYKQYQEEVFESWAPREFEEYRKKKDAEKLGGWGSV